MASSSDNPAPLCGFNKCRNTANVTRCEREPPRCSRCCDCGKHRPSRKGADGLISQRGQRNPNKVLVRDAVNEHYVFLKHLQKVINDKFSDCQYYQEQGDGYVEVSFWTKHGLTTNLQQLAFCLSLAAASGVSASDIKNPSRRTETVTWVCQLSGNHFDNMDNANVVTSAKQVMYKHLPEPAQLPLQAPDLQGQVEPMFASNDTLLASLLEPLDDVQTFITVEDIHGARLATARELNPCRTLSDEATGDEVASSSSSKRPRPPVPVPLLFSFEEDKSLKNFPTWAPMSADMPKRYEQLSEKSGDDFMEKIRNAPPCERLRHLCPRRKGWWCFLGTPLAPRTAHVQLKTITLKCGDVNRSVWNAWIARAPFGTSDLPVPQRAADEFCMFLNAREGCKDVIKKMAVENLRGKPENDVLKQMAGGEKGFWLVCDLVGDEYVHQDGGKHWPMINGWHASSLYSVWSMLRRGPDFAFEMKANRGKAAVPGFYYHVKEQASLCSGYATYSPLSDSGFYYAPFFELRTPSEDPTGCPVSAGGSQQRVCQPHCTRFSRLLVHVIHMREVYEGTRDIQFNVFPGWMSTYEMDPDDSLATFVERCENQQDTSVDILYFRSELTGSQPE
jgi:hypothetical protein